MAGIQTSKITTAASDDLVLDPATGKQVQVKSVDATNPGQTPVAVKADGTLERVDLNTLTELSDPEPKDWVVVQAGTARADDTAGTTVVGNLYKVDGDNIGGGKPADPVVGDISATPGFEGGSGTVGDPFIITPDVCLAPGLSLTSRQTIHISNQKATVPVGFEDLSAGNAGGRFSQPTGVTDVGGNYYCNLEYHDTPDTPLGSGQVYNGVIRVGEVYFSWDVTQVANKTNFGPAPAPTASPSTVDYAADGKYGSVSGLWNDGSKTLKAENLHFSINGGVLNGSDKTVSDNDNITIAFDPAVVNAASEGDVITAKLYSTDNSFYSVFHLSKKTTPDAFTIRTRVDQEASSESETGNESLTGINAPTTISAAGSSANPLTDVKVSINGGARATVTNGTFNPGDKLQGFGTTGSAASTNYQATFTVGGVDSTWTVTTSDQTGTIEQPLIVSPTNGATQIEPDSPLYVLSSTYAPLDGAGSHTKTEWEVYTSSASSQGAVSDVIVDKESVSGGAFSADPNIVPDGYGLGMAMPYRFQWYLRNDGPDGLISSANYNTGGHPAGGQRFYTRDGGVTWTLGDGCRHNSDGEWYHPPSGKYVSFWSNGRQSVYASTEYPVARTSENQIKEEAGWCHYRPTTPNGVIIFGSKDHGGKTQTVTIDCENWHQVVLPGDKPGTFVDRDNTNAVFAAFSTGIYIWTGPLKNLANTDFSQAVDANSDFVGGVYNKGLGRWMSVTKDGQFWHSTNGLNWDMEPSNVAVSKFAYIDGNSFVFGGDTIVWTDGDKFKYFNVPDGSAVVDITPLVGVENTYSIATSLGSIFLLSDGKPLIQGPRNAATAGVGPIQAGIYSPITGKYYAREAYGDAGSVYTTDNILGDVEKLSLASNLNLAGMGYGDGVEEEGGGDDATGVITLVEPNPSDGSDPFVHVGSINGTWNLNSKIRDSQAVIFPPVPGDGQNPVAAWTPITGSPFEVTSGNKTRLIIQDSEMEKAQPFLAKVRYSTTDGGAATSEWSSWSTWSTETEYVPPIGGPSGGGYFAGQIKVGGVVYNLITAPNVSGSLRGTYGGAEALVVPQGSPVNGQSKSDNNANWGKDLTVKWAKTSYAPFNWVINSVTGPNRGEFDETNALKTGIGGYNDWYVPAKNELLVCYFFQKPSRDANVTSFGSNPSSHGDYTPNTNFGPGFPDQTTETDFKVNGPESWKFTNTDDLGYYCAEFNDHGPTRISFKDGQYFTPCPWTNGTCPNSGRIRAIRREPA